MMIQYPSLVEEAYCYQKKVDPTVTKAEIFQLLYHKGLIGPKGEPTKEALDSGYVKDYTESMDLTYTDFLILYPVFARFSADHFKKIDHFWEMDRTLQERILGEVEMNQFTEDELIDLSAYFEDRRLSEPTVE
ncbi:hypothetical protein [Enterococcus gallinarum]|uniref:hypothetical protein n=1 Tax=Enterococcus gallinarum TaxID=1353 RepID=UPI0012E0CFE9|nr:hypothetical protein [Enterococcus gallinarum]MUN91035.1 hypothetical protein [Enterococcus gallinarum]